MTVDTNKPDVRTYVVADVKCYLCGAISGTVESEQQPIPRIVRLRRPGETEANQVVEWRRLRCGRCGGPIYLDEPDVITRRMENYNWMDERPRRGRPPKRLVEERRREREELEHQRAA